jgi:hypothetical protein
MSSMQPADDFSKGMQTIERALIDAVWQQFFAALEQVLARID